MAKEKAFPVVPANSIINTSEFSKYLKIVGSGPKPEKQKIDNKGSLIKGTPFVVADIISLLRNTAHATKTRHPRSTGRMFSDIAQSSGNGEPVREGYGDPPVQVGNTDVWWYPGGAPPGYPIPGPDDTMVIMESGTIFGTSRQPWTDPGYPTQQQLEIDLPDDEEEP